MTENFGYWKFLLVLRWFIIFVFPVGLKFVTLEGNTTKDSGCDDIWVNFTCNSSVANPPAYDYLLLKNKTVVGFNKKGTWIEQISRGETFVYQCRAYQKFNNVTSSNSITVTVNGKTEMLLK